jgi:hypothetical protein
MKYFLIAISLVAGLTAATVFVGCDSGSGDGSSNNWLKDQSYYMVYALKAGPSDDEIVIGSKEGLTVTNLSQGVLTPHFNYSNNTSPSIAHWQVRSVAVGEGGQWIAVGTNGGLSVCLRKSDGAMGGCSSYTMDTNPALPRNNVKAVALIDNTVIAGIYHKGVLIGDISGAGGQIVSFKLYDLDSTPAILDKSVSSLAVNDDGNVVLIGTKGGGIGVGHFNSTTKSFDSISNIVRPQILHDFVEDIAIHKASGLVAIATRGGVNIGRLDNGALMILNSYDEDTLPFKQFSKAAINNGGTKIALGAFSNGLVVADIDLTGALSNIAVYSTETSPALPDNRVLSLLFSEDDTALLIGSQSSKADSISVLSLLKEDDNV